MSTRRQFMRSMAVAATAALTRRGFASGSTDVAAKAQIAITLDLEMARNFPNWDDTHWDYEKGNLNQAAKDYAVEACRRVRQRGGVIHNFVVGQVLEHANVDWLKEIAGDGHPIGNHTYDHVNLLAKTPEEIQYRFQRAPWLIRGRSVAEVLRENIRMTNVALKERVGVDANGFRTPGGFADGLTGRDDLQKMLLELGFSWVSGKYAAHSGMENLHGTGNKPSKLALDGILAAQSQSQPFVYPTGLVEVPMSPISDIGAFRNGRWQLDEFLNAIRQAVQLVIERRAAFDFLAHPSCLGVVDTKFRAIDLLCDLVDQSNGAAEIVSLDVIAKRAAVRPMKILTTILFLTVSANLAVSQGYSPEEAVEHMTTAKGLRVTLFASEPKIRQPIFVKCDDRGRVWTIQYLQYPNPAGLERVKVDRWSRTVYDRVPEPPPHGPRGADKITILDDTDSDGRADRAKDFVDGLNLATGVEFGHGGVFVLNVPYLLFYPDKNRDDVPDGDPEVLLTGFGMEDAQAMSNHLTWGPDGWLYGVNGSTTTCRIRDIEFQQGLWRYHPVTREFELFCEGGSNCYGVAFDANGECYYSTNGGPFVNAVQGGYFYKTFGKHGPLHNLFAYHYFPELERDQVPGGPPTGGTIYLANAFPPEIHGAFIAGNFLGHTVSWWNTAPTGSTVRAKYGGVICDSHDTWSGPTDLCVGPDGSIFVSDFYDQRTAHPDPDANWDRSNGRIYKISAENATAPQRIDIGSLSTDELIDLLTHENHWFSNRARVELTSRRDRNALTQLRAMATQTSDVRAALEGLWALHAIGGFDDRLALELVNHPAPYVRYWAARFVGDRKRASDDVSNELARLASREDNAVVRGLAATAKRLPTEQGMSIVVALLRHSPNDADSRVPWLIWWAIESNVASHDEYLVKTFSTNEMWDNPSARDNNLRLIRRFAAEGTRASYDACCRMIESGPRHDVTQMHERLRQGLAERAVGLLGIGQGELFVDQAAGDGIKPASEIRNYEPLSGPLREYINEFWREQVNDDTALQLALRAGIEGAKDTLAHVTFEPNLPSDRRVQLLQLLQEFKPPGVAPQLMQLVLSNEPDPARIAALNALDGFDDVLIRHTLLEAYDDMPQSLQDKLRDVLSSQPATALALLQQVDAGTIAASEIPLDQLRRVALHNDEQIDALVHQHWGNIGPGTVEQKLATMRRYNNDLRAGAGDPLCGKEVFTKSCATCHQLGGEGKKIGPDLTTANRQDRAALLGNIVDPSAVVRREYVTYTVTTTSGQVYSGLIAEQDGAAMTVLDAKNERVRIRREEIDSIEESPTSLMPERILDELTPQQIRDLFAFLESAPAK